MLIFFTGHFLLVPLQDNHFKSLETNHCNLQWCISTVSAPGIVDLVQSLQSCGLSSPDLLCLIGFFSRQLSGSWCSLYGSFLLCVILSRLSTFFIGYCSCSSIWKHLIILHHPCHLTNHSGRLGWSSFLLFFFLPLEAHRGRRYQMQPGLSYLLWISKGTSSIGIFDGCFSAERNLLSRKQQMTGMSALQMDAQN